MLAALQYEPFVAAGAARSMTGLLCERIRKVSPLRRRMIENIAVRNLSPATGGADRRVMLKLLKVISPGDELTSCASIGQKTMFRSLVPLHWGGQPP
jgi:hypothetical protein